MLNLLSQGPWLPSDIAVSSITSTRPVIPEIEEIITRTWAENRARLGDALFDGPMSRLESFAIKNNQLHLTLSTTSYRMFLGTNLCHAHLAEKFGRPALANAIGMSAALLTADNKLVMGRRNDRVAYYPNRIHPFAGALEPQDVPTIFNGIRRELAEELSLEAKDVIDLKMLAIIEDRRLLQPEFIFSARTLRTAAELQETLDVTEHRDLWMADASLAAMNDLLSEMTIEGAIGNDLFTPIGVGTLLMFSQSQFGNEWSSAYRRRFFT